jgi:hypothetical protein
MTPDEIAQVMGNPGMGPEGSQGGGGDWGSPEKLRRRFLSDTSEFQESDPITLMRRRQQQRRWLAAMEAVSNMFRPYSQVESGIGAFGNTLGHLLNIEQGLGLPPRFFQREGAY